MKKGPDHSVRGGFTKAGERLVARWPSGSHHQPREHVYSIKRFMGRRYDEVNEEMKMVPYKVVRQGDHVTVSAQGAEHTRPRFQR